MKVRIIFITLLIMLVGCNHRSKVISLLTEDKYKFWDFYRGEYKSAFFFHKDGRYYIYNYTYLGTRRQFHLDDELWPDTWKLISDDSLVMNGSVFKIVQVTSDSLKLVHKGIWNDSFSCFKSPNQFFK